MDTMLQATQFRNKSAGFREQAELLEDGFLRQQFEVLAARYLDIAEKMESLSVATTLADLRHETWLGANRAES
jgi:hypothetical protein